MILPSIYKFQMQLIIPIKQVQLLHLCHQSKRKTGNSKMHFTKVMYLTIKGRAMTLRSFEPHVVLRYTTVINLRLPYTFIGDLHPSNVARPV